MKDILEYIAQSEQDLRSYSPENLLLLAKYYNIESTNVKELPSLLSKIIVPLYIDSDIQVESESESESESECESSTSSETSSGTSSDSEDLVLEAGKQRITSVSKRSR